MISKIKDNILTALLITISIVGMVIICFTIKANDIWYDEVFSMEFASRSYKEIISLTGADVHPPLYYFYLKAVIMLGQLIVPVADAVVIAKFASVIPYALLLMLSVTVIRKNFGFTCGAFFAMLITVMPNLAAYYVEIRMYAFALLIVTLAFIFAYKTIKTSDDKNISYPVLFTLFGILGAYTQYYVCIAIVGIYICVGIYSLLVKRYKLLAKLGICAGISVVCYIPWIPYLLGQIGSVKESYWIEPLTLRSILGCVKYMYLPSIGLGMAGYAVAGIMIAATLFTMVKFLMDKPNKEALFIGISGIITLVITVLAGFVFSIMGSPIFVYRYMVPVFGMFYLGLSYMACETFAGKKILLWVVVAVFVIGGHYSLSSFEYEETKKPDAMKETVSVLESLPEDSVVITNFDQICTLMDYYLKGNTVYLYEDTTDPIVQIMYNNDGQSISEAEMADLVLTKQNVFFFGSFNSREELLDEWKSLGVNNELYYDSAFIERYYFNIYRLD